MIGNLPTRPRGFDSPAVKASSQPQASLAWRVVTHVLKRRQRVLKPCQLSLDIMFCVLGSSPCWTRGQHRSSRKSEWRSAGPGSKSRAKVRDGTPRNLGDPTIATCECRMVHGTPTDQVRAVGLHRTGANQETACGARERIHKRPGADVGSRSAFIVPLTSGNPAHGDPIEGRGASRVQTCAWETRRALRGP